MAVTKSAQKALRQQRKREKLNNIYRKKTKDLIKKIRIFIAEKKTEEAKKLLPEIYKVLDKSAKANIINKNAASRKKSRITKAISRQ